MLYDCDEINYSRQLREYCVAHEWEAASVAADSGDAGVGGFTQDQPGNPLSSWEVVVG